MIIFLLPIIRNWKCLVNFCLRLYYVLNTVAICLHHDYASVASYI